MAGKPQLSEDKRNSILEYLRKELSFNEIKDKVGVSLYTIHNIAKLNGIERKAGQSKGCEYQPTKYDRECSNIPLTHVRGGESFIENAF